MIDQKQKYVLVQQNYIRLDPWVYVNSQLPNLSYLEMGRLEHKINVT